MIQFENNPNIIKQNITTLENYLQLFFNEEKQTLLQNYPGLTLHRLRNDISHFALLNEVDSEDLFELAYIPFLSNPLNIFFEKLKKGVPLEYITGDAYFYRSYFKVSPDVLIPRSETEILVEMASQEIQKNYRDTKCRLIDIGTGSGIIALTLMMEDFAILDVVASDISDKALAIARENYFNLGFAISDKHSLKFMKSDRLKEVEGTFDIILSNPPYIKKLSDRSSIHQQVLNFEPWEALFLEDSEYELWFEDFFKDIFLKLNPKGICLIEGHENHLENLSALSLKLGFAKVHVIKDYTGRNRFLRITK